MGPLRGFARLTTEWMIVATTIVCSVPTATQGQASGPVLSGRIIDAVSGEPIPGAEIVLGEGLARVSSDDQGGFRITGVAAGTYAIHVVRIGYEEATIPGTVIATGSDVVEIALSRAVVRLSDIVVTPGTYSLLGRSPTPRQAMSRVEIESVPQFAEDIFRAVQRLPGLSSGDYAAHFSIRGGRHDETLILLDGLEIYEPYHLKDFNDGAVSIIDVETIESVELMTGGFPVRYGNRTSGVFSVRSREPDPEDPNLSVGISLVNARVMGQGRFANDRGSWFVSARRGYLDLMLDLTKVTELPSPAYHDLFGKVTYELADNHRLALNVLEAGDVYTFDAAGTTGYQDSIDTRELADNRYGNRYVWITHEGRIADRLSVTTIASAGAITSRREGTEYYVVDSSPIYSVTNRRDFSVLGLKQDWTFDWSDSGSIDAGFDLRALDSEYSNDLIVNRNPDNPSTDPAGFYPNQTSSALGRRGTTLGAYVGLRQWVASRLAIEGGLRYDRVSYSGDRDLSPRLSGLFRLGERTHLRVSWGRYRQAQGIGDLAVLNNQSAFFSSELSTQLAAGLEHSFASGGTLRVEAYRKRGDELRPAYRNWKGGLDTFPETNEDRILVTPSISRAQGVEISLRRNLSDRLSVNASYSFAEAEETVSDIENVNDPEPLAFEATHALPQDQRHAANLDATYRLSEVWSLNASYSFHSGWPGTLESLRTVTDDDGGTDYAIFPETIYGHRLPAYHRVDARFTRRTRFRGGDLRFFLEVSNLTNHENVFGYDYFRSPGSGGGVVLVREVETGFTIIPSLGISWSGHF